MTKFSIKVEGVEIVSERIKKVSGYEPAIKKCIIKSLADMKNRSQKITPKDTGQLRNSAFCEVRGDLIGIFGFTANYAPHVEYGHKIVRGGRQVGYKEGRGFLKRNAYEQEKIFQNDCENMMKGLVKK